MQSDGGLTSIAHFTGSRAILSGPAGGVVGYALTSYSPATQQPVIGFDMGGTSTDVSGSHSHRIHLASCFDCRTILGPK
jgi:5-oxoprolinase (ATP-hydrolysing)